MPLPGWASPACCASGRRTRPPNTAEILKEYEGEGTTGGLRHHCRRSNALSGFVDGYTTSPVIALPTAF
jgi:phosphoribosylcarboxyaminoimidazole (NCAIR) mutase